MAICTFFVESSHQMFINKMKLHISVVLAFMLAFADAVSASCSLRFINQSPSNLQVYDSGNNPLPITAGALVNSGYFSIPCNESYTAQDQAHHVSIPFSIPEGVDSTHFSLFVVPAASGASGRLLIDRDTRLGDSYTQVNIDTALYRICNAQPSASSVDIYSVTSECYNCMLPFVTSVPFGTCTSLDSSSYWSISTMWSNWFQVEYNGMRSSSLTLDAKEHGAYTIVILNVESTLTEGNSQMTVLVDVEGRNADLPVLYAFLILLGIGITIRIVSRIIAKSLSSTAYGRKIADEVEKSRLKGKYEVTWLSFFGIHKAIAKEVALRDEKYGKSDDESLNSSLLPNATVSKPKSGGRIRSIDTLRGLSLCVMMFVNFGGGNYKYFNHSPWNGLTVADLVFPWFVWTSGVSMAISFAGERRRGSTKLQLTYKCIVRAVKLYGLGLFINNGSVVSQWRMLGVLQYFAVSYLVVGLLETWLSPHSFDSKAPVKNESKSIAQSFWFDVGRYWIQWSIMFLLALLYFMIQYYLPVEGCPTGYIGAGGLADGGAYLGKGCTGGAHRKIDLAIFGPRQVYHNVDSNGDISSAATCAPIFDCDVYDPEGVLGWISACWVAWLGLQAGRIIVSNRHLEAEDKKAQVRANMTRWVAFGVFFAIIGGGMCGFSKNDGAIPINKNLWSPSFVCVLAGLGFLHLAFHYMIVDVWKLYSGAPFRYVGMNSIVVYCFHEVVNPYAPLQMSWNNPWASHAEALASNLGGMLVMVSIARIFDLTGTYINV